MWWCTFIWGTVSERVCVYNNHFPQLLQLKEKNLLEAVEFPGCSPLWNAKKAHKKNPDAAVPVSTGLQQFDKVESNEDRTELGLPRLLKWRVWIEKGSLWSRAYEVQYECYNGFI